MCNCKPSFPPRIPRPRVVSGELLPCFLVNGILLQLGWILLSYIALTISYDFFLVSSVSILAPVFTWHLDLARRCVVLDFRAALSWVSDYAPSLIGWISTLPAELVYTACLSILVSLLSCCGHWVAFGKNTRKWETACGMWCSSKIIFDICRHLFYQLWWNQASAWTPLLLFEGAVKPASSLSLTFLPQCLKFLPVNVAHIGSGTVSRNLLLMKAQYVIKSQPRQHANFLMLSHLRTVASRSERWGEFQRRREGELREREQERESEKEICWGT